MAGADPGAEAPGYIVVSVNARVLHVVDVKSIARLAAFQIDAIGAVKVSLNLNVGAFARRMLPAGQQIASGNRGNGSFDDLSRGRRRRRKSGEVRNLTT